jgi:hypothetical protein
MGLQPQGLNPSLRNLSTGVGAIPSSGILRYEFEQDLTDSWNNNDAVADNSSAGFVTTAQEGSYSKEFDGTDDYITADTWSNLGFSNGDPYSIVFWMYPQDVSSTLQRTLGTQTGGPGIVLFHNRNSNGDLSWYHDDGSNNSVTSSTTLSQDSWAHVAGTFDGTTLELFIDASSEGTVNRLYINSSEDFNIGTDASLQNYFDGYIDHFDIYDKALTQTEVQNHKNTGSI